MGKRAILLFTAVAIPPVPGMALADRAAYVTLTDLESLDGSLETWCHWIVKRVLQGQYQVISMQQNPYDPLSAYF